MRSLLNKRIQHLELPDRMSRLPVSDEGYPIPWFVAEVDGKRDFRVMDGEKLGIAVRLKRCWMCGQPLGKFMTFPIGPMCAVNRNIAEPPSHHGCAEYGARACPFLTQPRMRRNGKDLPEDGRWSETGLKRNPGVICLWTTLSYRIHRGPDRSVLFAIGDPVETEWFCEGRPATRAEIMASIESGLPILRKMAQDESQDAVTELTRMVDVAMKLVPA